MANPSLMKGPRRFLPRMLLEQPDLHAQRNENEDTDPSFSAELTQHT